jgi:hypothetical protein
VAGSSGSDGNGWKRFEAKVYLEPSRHHHILEVSLVLGYKAATYLIDDVHITQTAAPPPPPP